MRKRVSREQKIYWKLLRRNGIAPVSHTHSSRLVFLGVSMTIRIVSRKAKGTGANSLLYDLNNGHGVMGGTRISVLLFFLFLFFFCLSLSLTHFFFFLSPLFVSTIPLSQKKRIFKLGPRDCKTGNTSTLSLFPSFFFLYLDGYYFVRDYPWIKLKFTYFS